MTVYADVLFALNAAVNYLMLRISARVCGAQMKTLRLLLAAALGGLYAVLALAPGLAPMRSIWCKTLVWGVMLVCAFGAGKKTVKLALVFLAASFAFGGAMFALVNLLGTGVMVMPSGAYYPVSAGALLSMAGVSYLLAWLVFSRLGEHTGGQIEQIILALGDRRVTVRALHDSGNTLKDPLTGEPVLVAGWQTAQALFPSLGLRQEDFLDASALALRLGTLEPAAKPRLISYRAVGTPAGLLTVVRCQAVKAGRQQPVLVAFSPEAVSDAGNFDALTGG